VSFLKSSMLENTCMTNIVQIKHIHLFKLQQNIQSKELPD